VAKNPNEALSWMTRYRENVLFSIQFECSKWKEALQANFVSEEYYFLPGVSRLIRLKVFYHLCDLPFLANWKGIQGQDQVVCTYFAMWKYFSHRNRDTWIVSGSVYTDEEFWLWEKIQTLLFQFTDFLSAFLTLTKNPEPTGSINETGAFCELEINRFIIIRVKRSNIPYFQTFVGCALRFWFSPCYLFGLDHLVPCLSFADRQVQGIAHPSYLCGTDILLEGEKKKPEATPSSLTERKSSLSDSYLQLVASPFDDLNVDTSELEDPSSSSSDFFFADSGVSFFDAMNNLHAAVVEKVSIQSAAVSPSDSLSCRPPSILPLTSKKTQPNGDGSKTLQIKPKGVFSLPKSKPHCQTDLPFTFSVT
jgi:hypothetical protein